MTPRTLYALRLMVADAERAVRVAETTRKGAEDDVRDAREHLSEARALLAAATATEVPCG